MCREAGILVIHASQVLRADGSNMGVLGEVVPQVRDGIINKGTESAALHKGLVFDPRDILLEKPLCWLVRSSARSEAPRPSHRGSLITARRGPIFRGCVHGAVYNFQGRMSEPASTGRRNAASV